MKYSVTVRLDEELGERVRAVCDQNRLSASAVVRLALIHGLPTLERGEISAVQQGEEVAA